MTTQYQHLDATRSVGEWVAADYRLATVFTRHGIDFCCGGGKAVDRACADKGITVDNLLQDARAASDTPAIGEQYNQWPVDFLADYIVNQFHTYTREMLDHIGHYAEKVAHAHGAHHPETIEIAARCQMLRGAMLAHMRDEEELLFPTIKQLAGKPVDAPALDAAAARELMEQMGDEHEEVGGVLAELAELSGGYALPEDACNTFRALYGFLPEFEDTTKKHIHLENNILFPKTLKLAQA